jgi:predicted metal-dependent phosphoesterase TrpH
MYADLHMHTIYSDGTDSPREIFELAKLNGLNTIAITDHDCIDGVKDANNFRNEYNLSLIDAVELSAMWKGRYVHVLGYYIDIKSIDLYRYIKESSADKTENTRINFENAKQKGIFSYNWERVLELIPKQNRLSGLHVVRAMKADGYNVPGMEYTDIFQKYFLALSDEFIDTEKKTPYDSIDVIKAAGGIPILAHPKLIGSDEDIMEFINYGAEGLEAYHPIHSAEETEKYLAIAADKALYITGGTDWHGGNNSSHITHFGMRGLDHWDYPILQVRR